jgi:hypothetical protein
MTEAWFVRRCATLPAAADHETPREAPASVHDITRDQMMRILGPRRSSC